MPVPDADPPSVASLGIVPVDVGDTTAPLSCAALRELRGRPLLHWAVAALTASGVVRRVVVAVPPGLEAAARGDLAGAAADRPDVLTVEPDVPGRRVLAALRAARDEAPVIVVHDPLHALAPPALVRALVWGLASTTAAAAVPARPVTDTLKWVDDGDVVRDTVDREGYRLIGSPQAYRREALLGALAGADEALLRASDTDVLARLVGARGGEVLLVPSPGEAFRVVTEDDLVLAEALLDVG